MRETLKDKKTFPFTLKQGNETRQLVVQYSKSEYIPATEEDAEEPEEIEIHSIQENGEEITVTDETLNAILNKAELQ